MSSNAAKPHRLQFLPVLVGGGVLLFFGLDIHFFRVIRKYPMGPNDPIWIFMSALGAVMVIFWIKCMIKPPSLTRREDEFDPSGIDDPIARQTEWTPMEGGANFCTHRLVEVGENRLEFQSTKEHRSFNLTFILLGLVILIPGGMGFAMKGAWGGMVAVAVIGGAFTAFGVWCRHLSLAPIVFDRALGLYWKNGNILGWGPNGGARKHTVRFTDVHAIQLISSYGSPDKRRRGYTSCELILVMKNASRVSVVNHGGRKELIRDATTLSKFFGLPLWKGF